MDPQQEITAWIDDRLADTGSRRRGPVREVRNWVRALVLTVETDRGRCWVKVVPDLFSHEVAVTELLADVDPGIVPPVVAADRALGRIITEHVDGPALDTIDDAPTWRAALSRLAEIQRVLAADPLALRVAGVAASPLDELAASLPELLADDRALLVGAPGGLSADGGGDHPGGGCPSWSTRAMPSPRSASRTASTTATWRPTR